MDLSEKFNPIRKGLLEFLILKIVAANEVYVADIACRDLRRLVRRLFGWHQGRWLSHQALCLSDLYGFWTVQGRKVFREGAALTAFFQSATFL